MPHILLELCSFRGASFDQVSIEIGQVYSTLVGKNVYVINFYILNILQVPGEKEKGYLHLFISLISDGFQKEHGQIFMIKYRLGLS